MKIVTLGCGNMASSIILGAYAKLSNKLNTYCYTPSNTRAVALAQKTNGQHLKNLEQLEQLSDVDFVMVACKPQQVQDLAENVRSHLSKNTHIVSILAGTEISTLQKLFVTENVTRIMPSTPTLVGKGTSLVCHSSAVTSEQKANIEIFFNTCSKIFEMNSEKQLDIVTTISGCGPAYIFNFANALTSALQGQGVDQALASDVVRELFTGASELMQQSKELSFSELQNQVTSKGGITMEAIKVFDQYDLTMISKEAISAALKRTKELQNLSKNV